MTIAPKQKVPTTAKTPQWYKDNGKFIYGQARFWGNDRSDMLELYKAATGQPDPSSYKHVTNPFNSANENLRQFPAKMRNYDIIVPIINLFLGEKTEAPFNHTIVCTNADAVSKNNDELTNALRGALAISAVNALNDAGFKTGVPSKEVPTYEEIKRKHTNGIKDERAIDGQRALDYLKYQLSLKDRFVDALFDWLTVGRVYTYKDAEYNDVIHEVVSPLEIWHGPTRTRIVEDAPWALRKSMYHLNDVVDKFHKDFAEYKKPKEDVTINEGAWADPLTRLEEKYRNGDTMTSSINGEGTRSIDSERDNGQFQDGNIFSGMNQGMIEVCHAVWKGFKKIGLLKYKSEYGGVEEMEVDEDYKLRPEMGDIELNWEWMNVVHEVYIVDEDIFLRGRECPVQRNELANTSKCKLPYNGIIGYSERDKINSIVKQLLPYQVLSNTYHYRLELIIAKNKEKIGVLPLGLMPNGQGWDEDKWLHVVEAMSLLVVDETASNAKIALDGLKSIDMSLGKYVSEMIALIRAIKEEAWDSIGMNRQRYGDTNASDGKGVNEQALLRSSVISRNMFRQLERFEESDIQGLIEYSKAAWVDGKKGAYITSDGQQAFLDLPASKWLNADVEVFAVNSQEERENIKLAKEYAFGFAQKGNVSPGVVMDTIGSSNFAKLREIVNRADEIQKAYEESVAAQEAENAQALKQQELQKSQLDGQNKLEAEKVKGEYAIEVALIQAGSKMEGENNGSETDIDNLHDGIIEKYRQNDANRNKAGNDAAKRLGDNRLKEANLALGEKKLESSERIAKMNKNKYDK